MIFFRRRTRMRLLLGLILHHNPRRFEIMDQTPILLTNCADPTKATRYLGILDIADGTAVPTFTSTDVTKAAVVVGAIVDGKLPFGVYPLSTEAEANDDVKVTASLPGNPNIMLDFSISGQPAPPPPETDALDAASAVGNWPGAPTVPATPI